MTELHVSRIINALTSKGFGEYDTHHKMLWLFVDGNKTRIHTWVSHAKKQFIALVDCTLSEEEYIRMMRGVSVKRFLRGDVETAWFRFKSRDTHLRDRWIITRPFESRLPMLHGI